MLLIYFIYFNLEEGEKHEKAGQKAKKQKTLSCIPLCWRRWHQYTMLCLRPLK